jgi:transcriptional regulator with XRE-family HTH domain
MTLAKLKKTIGRQVRAKRDRLGLTQEALAQSVRESGCRGMTGSAVSAIENGRVEIGLHRLHGLSVALQCSADYLLGRSSE